MGQYTIFTILFPAQKWYLLPQKFLSCSDGENISLYEIPGVLGGFSSYEIKSSTFMC